MRQYPPPDPPPVSRSSREAAKRSLAELKAEMTQIDLYLRQMQGLMHRRDVLRAAISSLEQYISEAHEPQVPDFPGEVVPLWKRAQQVLEQSTEPLTVNQISDAMIALGWKPEGKTPGEALRTTLIRKPELFERVEGGKFKAKPGGRPRIRYGRSDDDL